MCLQALHLLENAIIFDSSAVIPLQSSVFSFLAPTKFVSRVQKVNIMPSGLLSMILGQKVPSGCSRSGAQSKGGENLTNERNQITAVK